VTDDPYAFRPLTDEEVAEINELGVRAVELTAEAKRRLAEEQGDESDDTAED
jgi:hypothetical protein